MEWRLLASGLILDASGLILFTGFLWNFALQDNSISLISISIAIMAAFLVAGLALVAYGFVRKGIVNDRQAGALFLGSFAGGIVWLFYGFPLAIRYGDDRAACGGSPPGVLWSPNDTILTRCDVFNRVPLYPLLNWVWVIALITVAIVFLSSLIAARRNSMDGSRTVSSAQH